MATPKTVWGIDIGQCALKALKLRNVDGVLEVEAFDTIEHSKILSQPDADRATLIRNALEQFLARNDVTGSQVAVGVPSQSGSFTRFVKLPPVESKRIPDIVRFEAEQQIPFPINDVIWRWQTFQDPDSPDVEVGIFAMKREDVTGILGHFNEVSLKVDVVQMPPLALYNFMTFDEQVAPEGATLLADVGADKTDLVIADGPRIWMRTIQIGGNNFTEALVRAFKLSFDKAEKLKRTAASSKYARQIFQAMRPVFADLVQEIQRSVGYYISLHREARFKRLVGLGNGFRLPGLQKFLEQNLNMPVVRIDSYNKLTPSDSVNAPAFTENVLSFAVAYGLAIQGAQEASVETNLLPDEVSRQRRWAKKRPWFVAAAAMILACLAIPLYRSYADKAILEPSAELRDAKQEVLKLNRLQGERRKWQNQGQRELEQARVGLDYYKYRPWFPSLWSMQSEAAGKTFPNQKLLATPTVQAWDELREKLTNSRDECDFMVVEDWRANYLPRIGDPKPGQPAQRGFDVVITGWTPLPRGEANRKLTQFLSLGQEISRESNLFTIVSYKVERLDSGDAVAASTGGRTPKPSESATGRLAASETEGVKRDPMSCHPSDTRFVIHWIVAITGDGVTTPTPPRPAR